MAKNKKKSVPPSVLKGSIGTKAPIPNTEYHHSFVLSMIYFEDEGPLKSWSHDPKHLCDTLVYLGNKQRDPKATTPNDRDHYQKNLKRIHSDALSWMRDRPGVDSLKDYLWTYHLNGEHRIWGILIDNTFYLLWNDPEHKIYLLKDK